jgi:hypothetical protein
LSSSENALLRELEIGDLSAWGPCAVEFDYPMCGDCYSRLVRSRMEVRVYHGSVQHHVRALNPPKGGTPWPFGVVHKPPRVVADSELKGVSDRLAKTWDADWRGGRSE